MNLTVKPKLLLSEQDIELIHKVEKMLYNGISDEDILFTLFGVLTKEQEKRMEDDYYKQYGSQSSLAEQNLARRIRKTRWLRSIKASLD